jgi:hypothetical protein
LSHFDALFNKFPDNELTLPTNTHVSFLDDPFTPAELDRTLASLQKNKAPGNDGLSNEFFVAFDLQNRLWLLKFFNNILTTESCSQSWSDHGTKIFTALLTARLAIWAEMNGWIPEI